MARSPYDDKHSTQALRRVDTFVVNTDHRFTKQLCGHGLPAPVRRERHNGASRVYAAEDHHGVNGVFSRPPSTNGADISNTVVTRSNAFYDWISVRAAWYSAGCASGALRTPSSVFITCRSTGATTAVLFLGSSIKHRSTMPQCSTAQPQ